MKRWTVFDKDAVLLNIDQVRLGAKPDRRPITNLEGYRFSQCFDRSDQPLRRNEIDIIVRSTAWAATDRHEIGHDKRPTLGVEDRSEDISQVHIGPRY